MCAAIPRSAALRAALWSGSRTRSPRVGTCRPHHARAPAVQVLLASEEFDSDPRPWISGSGQVARPTSCAPHRGTWCRRRRQRQRPPRNLAKEDFAEVVFAAASARGARRERLRVVVRSYARRDCASCRASALSADLERMTGFEARRRINRSFPLRCAGKVAESSALQQIPASL
jgi:hypothetical protein